MRQAFFDVIETLERLRLPWWVWPASMVGMAVFSVAASLFFQPMGPEWVAWPGGGQLGDTCGMILATGQPCPQCGMTRSWVHGIRGDLISAFWFSPSGVALLGWIVVGGIIGAVRLITRNPLALRPSNGMLFGWVMFWLIPLYAGSYVLRLAGFNVLP